MIQKLLNLRFRTKEQTQKNNLPFYVRKGVYDLKAQQILHRLNSRRVPKGTLFFPFSILQLRKMFVLMVKDLGLNDLVESQGVSLDGPHCLRHGGMAYLVAGGYTASQLLVTSNTLHHYIRPNNKRARS
jgi:hypothetical protein